MQITNNLMMIVIIFTCGMMTSSLIIRILRCLFFSLISFVNRHRKAKRMFLLMFYPQESISMGVDYVRSKIIYPAFGVVKTSLRGSACMNIGDHVPVSCIDNNDKLRDLFSMMLSQYKDTYNVDPEKMVCIYAGKSLQSAISLGDELSQTLVDDLKKFSQKSH